MKRRTYLSALLFLFFAFTLNAQKNPLDTLIPRLKAVSEKDKAMYCNKIAKELSGVDSSEAMKYANQALTLSKKFNIKIEMGLAYHIMGLINQSRKHYPEALSYFDKAIEIRKEIKDLDGLSKSYNNKGIINFNLSQYDEALDYYKKALLLKDELKDSKGKANTLNNIANVHNQKSDFEEAIKCYKEALTEFEKLKSDEGRFNCLVNIGVAYCNIGMDKFPAALQFELDASKIAEKLGNEIYMSQAYSNIGNTVYSIELDSINTEIRKKNKLVVEISDSLLNSFCRNSVNNAFGKSLGYYLKSLELRIRIQDKKEIANSLGNIGIVYMRRGEYDKALDYYNRALKLNLELNLKNESAINYTEIARLLNEQNQPKKALDYLHKSLAISIQTESKAQQNNNYSILSKIYARMKDYERAYTYKVKYAELQDEISKSQSMKSVADMEKKYQSEKKQAQIEQMNTRQKQLYLFMAGIILILVLSVIASIWVFRLYGQIKSQNAVLQQQKEEIEAQRDEIEKQRDIAEKQRDIMTEQKKEITDSIHYAQRIQRALLPQDEDIRAHLSDHFVLFRPRDIVSGDFFWFTHRDDFSVIAAADCTGHGVPGAFMSVLGVSLLNEIVNHGNVTRADEILNHLRNGIKNSLGQSATSSSTTSTKDGMDIAICVIHHNNNKMEYAGAHNQLYLFRSGGEFFEYDADHMPVGVYSEEEKPFTLNEMEYKKGDTFYIFSDGYCDQFGGPKGKKFKSKTFKELLSTIQDKNMHDQGELLETVRLDWMGTEFEQIDDVCVIGFRL